MRLGEPDWLGFLPRRIEPCVRFSRTGPPTFFTIGIARPRVHRRLGRGATIVPLRLTSPRRLGLAADARQP